ncbi:MAG: nuclear transport factor 2 family protein [Acidobacteria bacterium]|nr:nuclear transport factor 2 family protein [Acidobacteriota bacterium]
MREMLSRITLGMLLALLAVPAVQASEDAEAVLKAQDQRWALTAGGDLDELEAMLTDDMTYTHSSAAVDTKASFLDSLRSGRVRYLSIEPEGERSVRVYGDAAVVQGVAHVLVKVPDRDIDVRLRFTELFVKQDGAWKMALWHSTTVP